ncbi:hypothetical protein LSH36_1334g00108 [Paralvinella palmiformis]|uniref:Uncharacterized protein n=1 Tax=Paralvinella palmiformis TaxID=53620 RepID=A0AAD9IUH5_9ANNE|nr:hypothetical protein LSH36_1334g00108 [Paralvinella palmiformis]
MLQKMDKIVFHQKPPRCRRPSYLVGIHWDEISLFDLLNVTAILNSELTKSLSDFRVSSMDSSSSKTWVNDNDNDDDADDDAGDDDDTYDDDHDDYDDM